MKFGFFMMALGVAAAGCFYATEINAQAPANSFSGIGGENAKKPIDIESDRLEVDDKRQVAIFSGNVSATQGDFNLRSKVLEVTYERASSPAGGKPAKGIKTAGADDPIASGQIKFIHATGGRVLITSKKDDQTASGNEGFYDVKAQKITMTGDVTLSQNGNVVQGDKLYIDLATGRAFVDPGSGTSHRVRAIFRRGNEAASGAAKKKPKGSEQNSNVQNAPASEWRTQRE